MEGFHGESSGSSSRVPEPSPDPTDPPAEAEPAAPDPDVYTDNKRRQELLNKFQRNTFGFQYSETLDEQTLSNTVEKQLMLEKQAEAALLREGYDPKILFDNKDYIRSELFYPNGHALNDEKLNYYIGEMHDLARSDIYLRMKKKVFPDG